MYQEAIDQLKEAAAINPEDPRVLGALGYAYARAGHRDLASSVLNELIEKDRRADMATALAWVYAGLDDKERAFEWLEKAYQRRSPFLPRLGLSPANDQLRSDPRFKDLLQRLGVPP